MAAREVTVTLEALDYEFGGWCRSCLLPSGVRVMMMITAEGPKGYTELRTFDRCVDCGGDQVDPPESPDVDHL